MKRLTKSRSNVVVFGVLGGIGEYFDIDPVILRVVFVFLTFLGIGSTIPLYIILALVMPDGSKSSASSRKQDWKQERKQDWREAFRNQQDTYKKPQRKNAENAEEDDWSDF